MRGQEEVERVHGNTRTYMRSGGALSSVPSAPSDVGQCSRLRRSRELLIKLRFSGLWLRLRRDVSHSRFARHILCVLVVLRLNLVVPVTLTHADNADEG